MDNHLLSRAKGQMLSMNYFLRLPKVILRRSVVTQLQCPEQSSRPPHVTAHLGCGSQARTLSNLISYGCAPLLMTRRTRRRTSLFWRSTTKSGRPSTRKKPLKSANEESPCDLNSHLRLSEILSLKSFQTWALNLRTKKTWPLRWS